MFFERELGRYMNVCCFKNRFDLSQPINIQIVMLQIYLLQSWEGSFDIVYQFQTLQLILLQFQCPQTFEWRQLFQNIQNIRWFKVFHNLIHYALFQSTWKTECSAHLNKSSNDEKCFARSVRGVHAYKQEPSTFGT